MMNLDVKKSVLMVAIAATTAVSTPAVASSFKVSSIKYVGLRRISASTVANYLDIKPGQVMTSSKSVQTIKALYKTGFFQAVELERQGQVLVVRVVERGTIGRVKIDGNSLISTDQLKAVLKELGITKGNVFQKSALERFRQQLKNEYNSRGKYNAQIITKLTLLDQNRIGVEINISEGRVARISKIRFMGNKAYSDSELKSKMQLSEPGLFTYFTKKDQYNQVALDQSLQEIRNFYMDHGYLKFKVESSQVMLSTDHKSVYINIKVNEGPQYHFSGFDISGKTIMSKQALQKLVDIDKGEIFSRTAVTDAIRKMSEALGDLGYGFPAINAEPRINEADKTIFISFVVQPGRHVYVRRINFNGNTKTADYVLRQAIRQNEGALLSYSDVKESERQIKILGYLKNVKVRTTPVAGANNQVDLDFDVEEAPSAEASLSVGYGTNGPELNAGFNQHNFMGTGRTVGFNFNTSYWGKNYSVNYYDPVYYEGIGRGFNVFYQTVNPRRLDISSYTTDKYGFNVNYNFTIGDNASIQLGYGLDRLKITSLGSNPATQLSNFVSTYGNRFDQLKLTGGWNHNTYDQMPYPTKGMNEQLSLLVALPVSSGSLKYYKVSYQAHAYYPFGRTGFIFTALGNVGFGSMFNGRGLPFFENYFAGGIAQPGQVRGFESFSLGPLDSTRNNLGGNFLVSGSLGIIMPRPLSKETVRTTAFVDFGNVYGRGVPTNMRGTNSGPLRYSAGVSVDWRSPFGPLSFSVAKPIKTYVGDQTNYFQFNVSSGF